MAFAYSAEIGEVADKTAGTTIVLTVGATGAAVGDVLVARTGWDPEASADGTSSQLSIADSKGNTWTKAIEYSEVTTGADDGVCGAIFFCTVTSALSSGDTITVTSTSSRTASVLMVTKYTIGAGSTAALADGTSTAAVNAASGQPGAISTSGMTSEEHLHVYAFVNEVGDAGANITGFDTLTDHGADLGTTGGAGGSNIRVDTADAIGTGTGLTADPVASTGSQHVQLLVALREVVAVVARIAAIEVIDSRRSLTMRAVRSGPRARVVQPRRRAGTTRPTPRPVKRAPDSTRRVKALIRDIVIVRAPRLAGTSRTTPRMARRPTLRGRRNVRALFRDFVYSRPPRTGMPASSYTRTTKPVLVRHGGRRKLVARGLWRPAGQVVKPTFRSTSVIVTARKIGSVFVRVSRRPVRALDRRMTIRTARSTGMLRARLVPLRVRRRQSRPVIRDRVIFRPRHVGTTRTVTRLTREQTRKPVRIRRRLVVARSSGRAGTARKPVRALVPSRRATRRALARSVLLVRSFGGQGVTVAVVVTGFFGRSSSRPGADAGTPGASRTTGMLGGGADAGTPSGGFFDVDEAGGD